MAEDTRRYLCVNCDLGFDVAPGNSGDEEPRCPRCMRKNVVEQNHTKPVPRSPMRFVALGAAALALVAGIGGYVAWSRSRPATVGTDVPERPLEQGELRGHLRRLGVDRPEVRGLFASSDAVRALLAHAGPGAMARAHAIRDRLVSTRTNQRRVVLADPRGRRSGPFHTPAGLARSLAARSGTIELSSIEAAMLGVVALRDADVDARVVEVWEYENGAAPPDPTGVAGYYFVEVRDGGRREMVDVLHARGAVPRQGGFRALDDVEAVSAALAAHAMVSMTRDQDAETASALVEEALRLDPRSVVARTVRGTLLASTGAVEQAMEEARAAEALRGDPPRLVFRANLLLATGSVAEAEPLVRRAVAASPRYAAAHAMLAALALARPDPEAARTEIDVVEELEPTNDALPSLWAGYYIVTGNPDAAAQRIEAMVAARPREPSVRMQAAYTLLQAQRRERAVFHLRAAMGMVDGAERQAMLDRIGRTFGVGVLGQLVGPPDAGPDLPDALEPGDDDDGAGEPAGAAAAGGLTPPGSATPGGLRLERPTLGGRPSRPSILQP